MDSFQLEDLKTRIFDLLKAELTKAERFPWLHPLTTRKIRNLTAALKDLNNL